MVCCAGVHARETINPIVIMRIIEYYAYLYVTHKDRKINLKRQLENSRMLLEAEYEKMLYGSCIYELLQTFTILFVPLLNPDGYMISLNGFDAVRNEQLQNICLKMNISHQEWKFNARGRDINRNFPSRLWQPKNADDSAASENETKALIQLFNDYKTNGFLDFHSRGKSIYYYRKLMSDGYNRKQLEIAKRFVEITNYELVVPEDEVETGDSGGNTVHYYSEYFYKPALTIETVEDEAPFPLDYRFRISVFEELKLLIFEFGGMII
jgi:g-D-glutamyl-meso-diaminopimelate peptidase